MLQPLMYHLNYLRCSHAARSASRYSATGKFHVIIARLQTNSPSSIQVIPYPRRKIPVAKIFVHPLPARCHSQPHNPSTPTNPIRHPKPHAPPSRPRTSPNMLGQRHGTPLNEQSPTLHPPPPPPLNPHRPFPHLPPPPPTPPP